MSTDDTHNSAETGPEAPSNGNESATGSDYQAALEAARRQSWQDPLQSTRRS